MDSRDYGSPKPLARNPATTSSGQSSSDNDAIFAHKEHQPPTRGHATADDQTTLRPVDTYQTYEEHGVLIDGSQGDEQARKDYEHHKHLWWYRVRYVCRDAFAEFCGTMIMIIFGDGSVAQVTLSANPRLPESSREKGDYQSISWVSFL